MGKGDFFQLEGLGDLPGFLGRLVTKEGLLYYCR